MRDAQAPERRELYRLTIGGIDQPGVTAAFTESRALHRANTLNTNQVVIE